MFKPIFPEATYRVEGSAYFNDKSRKVAVKKEGKILTKPENFLLILYKNITGYELLDDGTLVSSGGLGRAVVGGVIAGGAGAVVGAITGRKTKEMSENLRVRIYVKGMSKLYYDVPLLCAKVNKDGGMYKSSFRDGKAICAKLDSVIERNKVKKVKRKASDPTELLRKYKALVDEGIISQEDFEKKKKKILDID